MSPETSENNLDDSIDSIEEVGSGLKRSEIETLRKKVDVTGKCCEGGSEGWMG